MTDLSLEEFAGTGASSGSSSSSTEGELVPADQFAQASPSGKSSTSGLDFSRTLGALKATGGEAASLVDFILSAPGFLLSTGAEIGGTIQAAARGVPLTADQRQLNPVTAYTVGRQAGQTVGDYTMNPLKKVLDLFQSGDAYEQSKSQQGMSKLMSGIEAAGKWVEEKTGGGISRDSVPMLVDTLMSSSAGLAKPKTEIEKLQEQVRATAAKMRQGAEAEVKGGELSPDEFATRVPVQQQINDLLGIRSPAEQAQINRQRRASAQQAFGKTPEEGGDFGSVAESQFRAEERLGNQRDFTDHPAALEEEQARGEGYQVGSRPQPERIGQAEILRILQKPGHERSAEDLITLRAARKQEGKADMTTVGLLAAAGIGATAGILYNDDDLREATLEKIRQGAPGLLTAMFIPVLKDSPAVARAKSMIERGKPRAEVWKETGLFEGKDGVWRREISDQGAKLKTEGMEQSDILGTPFYHPVKLFTPKKVGDVLEHPELFKEYPEFKDMPLMSTGFNFGISGAYGEGKMYLSGGREGELRSTMLHELQHATQEKGGMARGGNTQEFLSPQVKEVADEVNKTWDAAKKANPELSKLNEYTLGNALRKEDADLPLMRYEQEELDKLRALPNAETIEGVIRKRKALSALTGYAMKQYRRLAGEVEARAVQKRADLSPEERRMTPPWESFDVPEDQFILRFNEPGPSALQEAVKAPGGMWHPEAVERLAEPLARNLSGHDQHVLRDVEENLRNGEGVRKEYLQAAEQIRWTQKIVRNYLNKYAGTERDPLKDVEIPSSGGMERWEHVWDQVVQPKTLYAKKEGYALNAYAADYLENWPAGAKEGEVGFRLHEHAGQRGHLPAIASYLSHVGDYLRQNVKPEDLQRYDLVRAVKETAENDKRVAKQMEKAQAASTKDLPVYKEYPDGFRWVELKLPEKLTEEQAKTVRPATKGEKVGLWEAEERDIGMPVSEADKKGQIYVALGADGKPVKNAYTGETAAGPSPEEAYLAGRLAEEGNTMGHCVGGYCPSVASGESRIFSLRDEKGKSHVTVEVGQRTHDNAAIRQYVETHPGERVGNPTEHAGYQKWLKERPADIVQIKGKQNRAPNKEYLPYVQDFVKSGKWGEVGDLQNTGMKRLTERSFGSPEYRDFLRKEVGDFFTEEDHTKAWEKFKKEFPNDELVKMARSAEDLYASREVPGIGPEGRRPRGEQGFARQELVMGLGAIGLGAVAGSLLSDDPTSAALLGALAGGALMLPGVRARLVEAVKNVDYMAGSLSTRIGNISPAIKARARLFEMRNLTEAHEYLNQVVPFMKRIAKMPAARRAELERAILTNDGAKVSELIKGDAQMVAAWRSVRNVLADLGKKLQGYGRFKSMKDDYFPRLVKDVEGLKKALGAVERTKLEQAIVEGDRAAMKTRGTPMSEIERSAVINKFLQEQNRAKGFRPGYTRPRAVEEITEKLRPFYHTPSEGLYAYVRGAVQDLETARFFGKDLAQMEKGGVHYIDLDTSIGNVVGRELAAKKISYEQAQQVIDMMKSRFRAGERASSRLVQDLKNLGNLGLLGNIVAGVTQVADSFMAVYAHDLRSTLTAMVKQLTGTNRVTAADFGLAEHIAEEFSSTSRTANWLNKVFKYAGFTAIDRFGKVTQLNAALEKMTRQVRSASGLKRLEAKYSPAFGSEFAAFASDLRAGRITERVRLALFSELSDMQPVSRLELPQAYLDHPNGRLIYMLKTFMLKQLDVARRDVYNEIKRGNVAKGLKNATEYALVLGISGAATQVVQDWIMGRDPHFNATDIAENILKTFGWASFVRDKAKQGHPVEALIGALVPPYKMMDDVIRRDPRAVRYIPIIGRLYYEWELGGREEAELRAARDAKKRGEDFDLSGRAQDYKREKAEKRREKRGY